MKKVQVFHGNLSRIQNDLSFQNNEPASSTLSMVKLINYLARLSSKLKIKLPKHNINNTTHHHTPQTWHVELNSSSFSHSLTLLARPFAIHQSQTHFSSSLATRLVFCEDTLPNLFGHVFILVSRVVGDLFLINFLSSFGFKKIEFMILHCNHKSNEAHWKFVYEILLRKKVIKTFEKIKKIFSFARAKNESDLFLWFTTFFFLLVSA